VRELVIQANNATQSSQTREAIADEISNLAGELLQLANSKSPSGEYIFAGYNSRTPAFAKSGAGFVYQGDQGQRLLQVSEDTQLAVRDNGADVFQGMMTGDGRFLLETPASNTGDGLVKMSSTIDAISDNYTITFIQANPGDPLLYSVSGEDVGAVATGTFAAGEAINFNGISIEIEGSLENGDSYAINRSVRQDVFQSVQAIANALLAGAETGAKSSKLANDLGQTISTMDQALEHLQSRRTIVGNRLQALDTRASENADGLVRLERQTSELNDLDFAEAVSRLNLQTTALQAAQHPILRSRGYRSLIICDKVRPSRSALARNAGFNPIPRCF
jgi:flagellar hook-associated protein 3 FlgL